MDPAEPPLAPSDDDAAPAPSASPRAICASTGARKPSVALMIVSAERSVSGRAACARMFAKLRSSESAVSRPVRDMGG